MSTATQASPRPFRAGLVEQEARSEAVSAPSGTLLADVSEFQPNINDGVYLAWSKAMIIRAAYGANHDDKAWYGGARRADLHKGGVRFLGIYQYLVAGQSGKAQAAAMHTLVGSLQRGEVLVADKEEGSSVQDLHDWYNAMLGFGYPAKQLWTYTGLSYGQAHGLLPVEWIAAYQLAAPSSPHTLWQFTSSFSLPGVGVADCSVYKGSIDSLAALGYQPPVAEPTGLQSAWRWCSKCQGLHYGPEASYCPAGSYHTSEGSGVYALPYGHAQSSVLQPQWRHCVRCQGLFYGPYAARSHCPAPGGGPHTAGISYDYDLTHAAKDPAGTQGQWRWCSRCQGLFFGQLVRQSRCPAPGGGPHTVSTSWDYQLQFTR